MVVLALDQGVKQVVLTTRPDIQVIPGFFSVTFGTNTGVAFGLFRDFPLAVTLLGLGLLLGLLVYGVRAAPLAPVPERTALSLLLGGASGNVLDRLRLGYVVDYLDVYIGQYHWPTFNLADSAITTAAGLLVLTLRARGRREAGARASGLDQPPVGGR
jgi:signal peptidase II